MEKLEGRTGVWHLKQELGRGSQGVVLLAQREPDGHQAAIKLFSCGMAAPLREIRALSRVNHPFLSRLLDQGEDSGQGWIALEYGEGTPFRKWWGQVYIPGEPYSPHRLRRLLGPFHRLCQPLAALHAQGLLHLDLGPQNVIVRHDDNPLLFDLGLSRPFSGAHGREVMEIAGEGEGAAAWVAPEQLRGEVVDSRTDLYALGAMLYTALAGLSPFGRLSDKLKLNAAPPSLLPLIPTLPPELDRLILSLLASSPPDRPGYAEDVAVQLAHVSGEEVIPCPSLGIRPLFRPPLVGRSPLLAGINQQLEWWDQQSQAGVLLLLGESGVGKTRLAMEIAQGQRRSGAQIRVGECLPSSGPLAPLTPVLGEILTNPSGLSALTGQPGSALLGQIFPPLRPYVPEPEGDFSPDWARLLVARVVVAGLVAAMSQRRWVLVIDDVQWADPWTLEVLSEIAGGEQPGPVVVATCRSEERPPSLDKLLQSPAIWCQRVERLGPSHVAELVAGVLATPRVGGSFITSLTHHSAGNAFFVTEYVRAAIALGQLGRISGQWMWASGLALSDEGIGVEDLPIPTSLGLLIQRRLTLLSPHARRVAECAAVLGNVVDMGLLPHLVEGEMAGAVEELLAREVLEEEGRGPAKHLRFVHHQIRTVAWEGQPEMLRAGRHGRAADLLEATPRRDEVYWYSQVGEHHRRAGRQKWAMERFEEGALRASWSYQRSEVERLVGEALACGEDPEDRLRLLLFSGREVFYFQGRFAEGLPLLDEALTLAQSLHKTPQEAQLHLLRGRMLRQVGQLSSAIRAGELALELQLSSGEVRDAAHTLAILAGLLADGGEDIQAESAAMSALVQLEEMGDLRMQAVVLGTLAGLADRRGHREEAWKLCQRALEIHRQTGNRLGEARDLGNLALLYESKSQWEQALDCLLRADVILAEIGYRKERMVVAFNQARVLQRLGRLEQAIQCAIAAESLAKFLNNSSKLVDIRAVLAALAIERDRAAPTLVQHEE